MKKIFGGNVHVSGKELVEAINDHAKHLFHPSKLRDMLHSHIDENRIKRRERKLKELQAKRWITWVKKKSVRSVFPFLINQLLLSK